jgi:serine/threonine protein kinase
MVLALEYLHSMQILYCDLKAENIIVDGDGHIKFTDFGCSRDLSLSPDSSITKSECPDAEHIGNDSMSAISSKDELNGTLEYMAPELFVST